jgi:pimeloyl-ACP methyl ester carboxylesterase
MATANINGVRLFYEISGTGEFPLVFVHGSWGSHHNWDLVVPGLAKSFLVVTYDRRGHSDSERPSGQGSVREDVADLTALIEHLGLGPAWVAGNSFGSSITLRLAGERSNLVRGIITHEPPLLSLLASDLSARPILDEAEKRVGAVAERIASGDHAGAAEQFVETVALGPGSWARLPAAIQQTFVKNAPTFLDECRDPEQYDIDLARLRTFSHPSLLTKGDRSPPMFAAIIAKLALALPQATVMTFTGAGHIPHLTHPNVYVEAITAFIRNSPNAIAPGAVAATA